MDNPFVTDYEAWVENGSIVPQRSVPEAVKWFLILECAERFHLRRLIETGTAVAETTIKVAPYFDKVVSFELMPTYYEVAVRNVKEANLGNVTLVNESSAGGTFKRVVESLTSPTLFYLDAHFSGEGTGKDPNIDTPEVPVREELAVITSSPYPHVIIIDDARCFDGEEFHSDEYAGYPSMNDIAYFVGNSHDVERIADAFVLTPKETQ